MDSMRISAISDVHVKKPYDAADRLLTSFLSHPLVLESDYVLLLGDIFDLMCGPHGAYLKDYEHLFSQMDELVRRGKKLFFIEGNHDVHLERLFKKLWKNGEVQPLQIPVTLELEGRRYYFSHGDEHDVHNSSYQNYMRFIQSPPLKLVADFIMPYAVLNFLGERASVMSRKKGGRRFDENMVREKFRQGVEITTKDQDLDFVIGGHSHVKDQHVLSNGKTIYLNNGYALQSKTFLMIEDHAPRFVSL